VIDYSLIEGTIASAVVVVKLSLIVVDLKFAELQLQFDFVGSF